MTYAQHAPAGHHAPAPPADVLATAAGRDLSAPIQGSPTAGVVGTFVVAACTFGLWPALVWPLRFSYMASVERQRLGRLNEWLKAHNGHPEARRLDKALASVRYVPVAAGLALVGAIVFLACLVGAAPLHSSLVSEVYHLHAHWPGPRHERWLRPVLRFADRPLALQRLFVVWTVGLSTVFLMHWAQVQAYAQSVRRYLDVFNKIVVHEALSPVFLAPLGAGVRPLWVMGALAMWAIGAPWGVPLMLAGAVQRRYALRAGLAARAALASRARDMVLLHRPPPVRYLPPPPAPQPARPPAPAPRVRCSTEGCRLPLPAGATFCPRCGRRAAPPLDRVA